MYIRVAMGYPPLRKSTFQNYLMLIMIIIFCVCTLSKASAQQYELNTGWQCKKANELTKGGEDISRTDFPMTGFMPAIVPGTVLTTLLNNKLIPDPFYGMNNKLIPDIYITGRDYYTYWFVKDIDEAYPAAGEHVWLQFRGVNYSCNVYLNGHKLNDEPDKGMYLRQSYDITPYLEKSGHNRLAVIVYPPDPVGNPNGGQGGDGAIAHSITNQYVAGWDWIQPIGDRNTGIWDKVFIKKTKQVTLENTHIITYVPGRRSPDGPQAAARIKVTAELENTNDTGDISGTLQYEVEGKKVNVKVKLEPQAVQVVEFPELSIDSPRLWWPNGYGAQNMYELKVRFLVNGKVVSDEEKISFGIRELKAVWNKKTGSRELHVNGLKIFIKGGNRILSDELLRFSKERYDAELRFHRDMNLNLIRVWGGGITERPEFYDACDKYGLLVMQDFWVSGDCNGRWDDPLKLEDTLARRKYPDDHRLFITSLEDQIKMLRNHPSLAFWCGGNEIAPAKDVLDALRDTLLPELDGTRFFFTYSNADSMSIGNSDGPYTIQPDTFFWSHKSFPFNSEVGSVGMGDYESLERFIPKKDMVVPAYNKATQKWDVDSVWRFHKYSSYDSSVEAYGHPKDVADFAMKAQLVNYNQYRALIEGATAHMWDWYTGIVIWKTQNPWTAMVGQMYDAYLDPNACLYGLQEGSKPLHVMYDAGHRSVMVANNLFKGSGSLKMKVAVYDIKGNVAPVAEQYVQVAQSRSNTVYHFNKTIDSLSANEGCFLVLEIYDSLTNEKKDENIYWLPDARGSYSGLQHMEKADVKLSNIHIDNGSASVTISNPAGGPVAFFNRISIIDAVTKKRILPTFYDNNYISVLPGEQRTVHMEYTPQHADVEIRVDGWNIDELTTEKKENYK